MFKGFAIGVLALLLAACGVPRPRHAIPQSPGESPSAPKAALPGTVYRIDAGHSELRILVYRAGPLARFGHNHVVVNRSIRGVVSLADGKGESTFSLSLPTAGFVVDDAQARREEGADFAAEVPDDAKSGTLHNMLSAALLDAGEFPTIAIRSVAAVPAKNTSGAAGAARAAGAAAGAPLIATVEISVAGHESRIEVPLNVRVDPKHLTAAGSLELRQTALGLTPYSLMLGALQVQDAMTVKFDIAADSG